jgi:hypothetical protein
MEKGYGSDYFVKHQKFEKFEPGSFILSDYTQHGNKFSGKSFAERNFCLKSFLEFHSRLKFFL